MVRFRLAPIAVCAGILLAASRAQAVPLLQLDISNGVYNTSDETTYATGQSFTLYAYLTPATNCSPSQLSALLNDTYYISAAIAPKVQQPGANLGSFSFNGNTIQATQDMVWGDPPLERYLGNTAGVDSGDLAKHDIYETYFKEFSFQFTPAQRAVVYNTETDPIGGPTPSSSGGMYYMAFQVDTSQLMWTHSIHFDMYSETVKNNTDIDVNKFAPFSHDAQSMYGNVPEPTSLVLFGTGLLGVVAVRLSRKRARPPKSL